jgi:hypothetical protein
MGFERKYLSPYVRFSVVPASDLFDLLINHKIHMERL